MTRARSARRGSIVFVGLVLAGFLATSASASMRGVVVILTPDSLEELKRQQELAERSAPAERRHRWFDVGVFALRMSAAHMVTPDQRRELDKILREATSHLPATDLAGLSAQGVHPILSEAFMRALRQGGPRGMSPGAEIAAEARDAVVTFGSGIPASLLDHLKPGREAAAPSAGGAQRSVYSVLVLSESPFDSATTAFALLSGLRSGISQGAGALSGRFRVMPATRPTREFCGPWTAKVMRENRAGVTLVANGSDLWSAASAIGFTSRVIVADAREPGSIEELPMLESEKRLPGTGPLLSPRPAGMRDFAGEPEPATPFRPYLLRPTPEEQARRLVEALRPEIRRIAVAIPFQAGNERLARAFGMVARESGRETQDIVYEPGRRDYGPEAAQFVATGAQAILFAGPGEETAEWLAALAAKNSSPFLLGTNELDPAGFHVRARPRLENAIVVGDDWDDRDTELVARMESQGKGSSEPGFRRGFRMGWTLARNVLEGSFTPSSLRLALDARAPRVDAFEGGAGMITGIQREAGSGSREVVVPLFAVRNGALVPLAAN